MHNISKFILTFFIAIPLVFAFGSQTVKQIDEIKNNTGTDIVLNPTDKVKINYFAGEKALQSTVDGELEESAVTNTELGFLSGVSSSLQSQIDSKAPLTRLINTTAPLQGGGDLTTDRTLSILQSGAAQDGYLSSTDWNTFNNKQNAITGTDGDLYYYNSGLSNLAIGTNGQILQVSALGFPEWVDLPPAVSVTTKGDLQTYSTEADRLPVGTDGQVLQVNSATSTGLEWVDADFYTSPLTTQGDILYRDATQDTRLGIGTEGQLLTVTSGEPAWQDAPGGGGGSAGINFVVDPSFEKNDLAFTNSLSGTTTYPLYTSNDKLYSEFNEVYFQIAHTGLSAASYSTSYTVTRTGLDGKQGLVSIWAKTAAELDLCVDVDTNGCDTTLTLINDDTWRKYEVPVVFGSGNVLLKFINDSITGDVTLQLDNVYVGTMPDGYIQQVGQAQFVGSLLHDGYVNCLWENSQTSYSNYSADNDCGTPIATGNVAPPDTKIPAVKIPNVRTDGYYRVEVNGMFYLLGGSNGEYRLSDGITSGGYANANSPTASQMASNFSHQFRFSSSGNKTIQIQSQVGTGGNARIYNNNDSRDLFFNVYFYPDSSSTIVTQETELTAKTANELTAVINPTTCAIESSNYDWITSITDASGTNEICDIDFSGLGLTTIPSLSDGASYISPGRVTMFNTITSSSVRISCVAPSTNTLSTTCAKFFVKLSKQGSDVNKSATIVGKFENINSTDLIFVDAYRGSAQTVGTTDTTILFNTIRNNNCGSCYNTSTGTFTTPRTSKYLVRTRTYMSSPDTYARCYIYKNTSTNIAFAQERLPITGNQSVFIDTIVNLNENDTLNVVCQTGNASNELIGSAWGNFFQIQEMPDYEAIVKNLSDQAVKCQTKYLTGDVVGTGNIADFGFNNLVVGKKYRVYPHAFYLQTSAATQKTSVMTMKNGATNISDWRFQTYNNLEQVWNTFSSIKTFTAIDNSLTFEQTTLVNMRMLYTADHSNSRIELCELPDTYVDTTKF